MRSRVWLPFALLITALCASCGEHGDKAIAYGDGLGLEWSAPAGTKQMRICAENYFTRDVVVEADAPSLHYELTVGPIRKRYMIVPQADYKITAYTEERSAGINKLYVDPDDRNGSKGLWIKIRF